MAPRSIFARCGEGRICVRYMKYGEKEGGEVTGARQKLRLYSGRLFQPGAPLFSYY